MKVIELITAVIGLAAVVIGLLCKAGARTPTVTMPPATAETAKCKLAGHLYDDATEQPISGAQVLVGEWGIELTTEKDGSFFWEGPCHGRAPIHARFGPGYCVAETDQSINPDDTSDHPLFIPRQLLARELDGPCPEQAEQAGAALDH